MSRKQRLTAVGTHCAVHVTPLYPQKLAPTSPTGGGRFVGIVRSRTKATVFRSYCCISKKQGVLLHLPHICYVFQDYYKYTSRNLKARLILKSTELNFAI